MSDYDYNAVRQRLANGNALDFGDGVPGDVGDGAEEAVHDERQDGP